MWLRWTRCAASASGSACASYRRYAGRSTTSVSMPSWFNRAAIDNPAWPPPTTSTAGSRSAKARLRANSRTNFRRRNRAIGVRFGRAAEFFLMAGQFVQIRVQRPGLHAAFAVGRKPQHAVARADGGGEFEDRLKALRAGAGDPTRRRPFRRDTEICRLRACERFPQRRFDRRPSGHGLDGPSEGQHVAPESFGQEQAGGGRGILRGCEAASKPASRFRRRPAA